MSPGTWRQIKKKKSSQYQNKLLGFFNRTQNSNKVRNTPTYLSVHFGSLIINGGLYISWRTQNSVKIVRNSNSVRGHSLTYDFSLELCKIQTIVYQTHSSGFERAQLNSVKAGIHLKWIRSGWKLSLWINHFLVIGVLLSSWCDLLHFFTPHSSWRQTVGKELV